MLAAITALVLFIIVMVAVSFYFYHVAIARADKEFLAENPDLAANADVENPLRTAKTGGARKASRIGVLSRTMA